MPLSKGMLYEILSEQLRYQFFVGFFFEVGCNGDIGSKFCSEERNPLRYDILRFLKETDGNIYRLRRRKFRLIIRQGRWVIYETAVG
jgi:hypothetical protein